MSDVAPLSFFIGELGSDRSRNIRKLKRVAFDHAARSLACAAPALTSPLRNFFPGGFERFQHSEKCRNLFVASDAAELSLRDE